jgi:PAT family beta-lactamase induction signal transducer AmpG
MADAKISSRDPWFWIPTLYVAEGLPYALAMSVSLVLYKNLGVSNTDIAFYTSWLYLPWVIKPLWSPVVDLLKTRRLWIWMTQLLLGAGLAGVALTIPAPHFFQLTLAFFWLLAFSSATHDIAADGFYMLAMTEREQAFFSGIRSLFFRVALICAQGLLVVLVGTIQSHTGLPKVQVEVRSEPGGIPISDSLPDENNQTNELRILASHKILFVQAVPREIETVKSVVNSRKEENLTNGFCRQEPPPAASRWQWPRAHELSSRFGEFLHSHFGPQKMERPDWTGNVNWIELHLTRPPGKEIVVTAGHKSGDKGISITEGSRLIFNNQNWDKPATVVFQLDPNLRKKSSAIFEIRSGNIPLAWSVGFLAVAVLFVCLGVYHRFVLPRQIKDCPGDINSLPHFLKMFFGTFGAFFRKPKIIALLLFLLLYRLGEAQLVKMVPPFLLDPHETGGLGLTTSEVGWVYGTIGVGALLGGGLLGGFVVARHGLKFWLWPMVLAIHLPDAVFIWLAYAQPVNFWAMGTGVAVEQFGYGFGFTAFMLYMIYIARGEHQTAHYAICTGFMALGMMLPGMWSGWLQEHIGYPHFFVWVLLATIPSFIVALQIPLEAEFGRRRQAG